jgi:hypothetical protein
MQNTQQEEEKHIGSVTVCSVATVTWFALFPLTISKGALKTHIPSPE